MNLRKSTFYNMLFSLLLQVVTMINGLIVPRLILGTFGSNINGLVSSITQFLNYISIIEGGLGSVILAALYKAVAQNDNEKVSSILVATKKFFREIGFIYIGYAVVLSLVYPSFVKTNLSYYEISLLVYVIAFSSFVQYMFSAPYRLLIVAEQTGYIVSLINILIIINLLQNNGKFLN